MKNYFQKDESEIEINRLQEYSQKIKESPNEAMNYINRAYTFMKLNHYYYALEDAYKVIIDLKCRSAIGFKVMSEIYNKAELFEESLSILTAGLRICKQSSRKEIMIMKKETEKKIRDKKYEAKKNLYIVLTVSLFLGTLLSSATFFLQKPDFIEENHLFFNFLLIFGSMACGYGFYKLYLKIKQGQRYNIARPPYNTLKDEEIDELINGNVSCIKSYFQNNEHGDGKKTN